MAKQSIGDLHAKITADAQQFVGEFDRADNAARRSAGRIDAEVTKLERNIKKKFSGSEFAKGVLGGLGIGSGFAAAQTAFQQVSDYYREQAEFAKAIEESTAKQLDYTKQIIALRQTDAQKQTALEKEFARKGEELAAAKAQRYDIVPIAAMGGYIPPVRVPRAANAEETVLIQKLGDEYAALGLQIDQAKKKASDKTAEIVLKAQTDAVQRASKAYEDWQKVLGDVATKMAANEEEVAKLVERYRDIADPAARFTRQISEVNLLLESGKLNADEAALAIGNLQQQMADDQKSRVNKALNDFFQEMDDMPSKTEKVSEAAKDMGFAFSSAFEDAVIGGEKLSDVARSLATDLARVALRMGVTNPILNSVFGLGLGTFGGGKADGGPVSGGTPYMVGENGPELMVPRTSGTIVPNHALAAGGRSGDSFAFTYNFASGATRQEIAGLIPSIVRASAGMVADKMQRGGAYRRAMA